MVSRRRQLVVSRTMETNRLEAQADQEIRSNIRRHIQWLTSEIKRIDALIAERIGKMPMLKEKLKLLREVNGVGPVVMAELLTQVPELGTLDRILRGATGLIRHCSLMLNHSEAVSRFFIYPLREITEQAKNDL